MRFTAFALLVLAAAAAAQPVVTASGETMRLRSSGVTASGGRWSVTLEMDDDNGNAALPSSYRRWWHCEIGNLQLAGETLDVAITRPGYTQIILPVWSLSTDGGQNFGPYQRVPVSATPVYQGGQHRFTLQTPPGVTHLRLAKYFPYRSADLQRLIAMALAHPSGRLRSVRRLGGSGQGRDLQLLEFGNAAIPDAGKRRLWIHAGIHPAETTSYFTVEGLVDFLLSGEPLAEALLEHAIVDVVPMANPDGVALGNYRTNAQSVNLEEQWASPYASAVPEIVALRTAIEQRMGTAAAPATNPIVALLNLHSSHDVAFPFHYQHSANPNFDLQGDRSGVIPQVSALERAWIDAFVARSPMVARGGTLSSSCGAPARPFVECMMHDRWSVDPLWSGAQERVMAITFEGTYGRGPDGVAWNTPDDYRQVGRELGAALADHLGVQPGATLTTYGAPCYGLQLTGRLGITATSIPLELTAAGSPARSFGVVFFGLQRQSVPLPPTGCPLLTTVQIPVTTPLRADGSIALSVALPRIPGLVVQMQCVTGDLAGNLALWYTSNGLTLSIR